VGFTTPNLPEVEPEEFLRRPLPARFGEKASEPAKLAQLSSTKATSPELRERRNQRGHNGFHDLYSDDASANCLVPLGFSLDG